jgi:hypothetical protein
VVVAAVAVDDDNHHDDDTDESDKFTGYFYRWVQEDAILPLHSVIISYMLGYQQGEK